MQSEAIEEQEAGTPMTRQIAITIIAVFSSSTFLCAQSSSGLADQADHPSNGVFEMTLSPIFPQVLAPSPRDPDRPLQDGVWNGVVAVTLKNISGAKFRCTRRAWWLQYKVEVFDSGGKPVPPTPFGESEFALAEGPHRGYSGPISLTDLESMQELTDKLDLATFFQLKRGDAFTIKVRRSRDLPQVDSFGRPQLPQMDALGRSLNELSATLVVKGGPGGRDN